jgi:hypothetical protein
MTLTSYVHRFRQKQYHQNLRGGTGKIFLFIQEQDPLFFSRSIEHGYSDIKNRSLPFQIKK